MQISVTYAEPGHQVWLYVDLPEGGTVEDAIRRSGVLDRFPHLDLNQNKVGVFGKVVRLDNPVSDGDRVEIYRPITADPKKVRRKNRPAQNHNVSGA